MKLTLTIIGSIILIGIACEAWPICVALAKDK
jgi:hypothetical protein